jgi:hypothetical protein
LNTERISATLKYIFVEIYHAEGSIRGQFIDNQHYANLRREHERYFNLSNGKVCYLLVISNDTIRHQDAAIFAKQIAEGRVVHHRIDLSQINNANSSSKKVGRGR